MPMRSCPYAPREAPVRAAWSGKEDRRQLAPPRDRHLIHRAPGLEELDELFSGRFVVPAALAAHDLDELVDRLLALAAGVQGNGQIEARLVVAGVGGDLLLQRA